MMTLLLLTVCLQWANGKAATVKEEKKQAPDCPPYVVRPEDIEKMTKCMDHTIMEQIIVNITAATHKEIHGLKTELDKMKSLLTQQQEELKQLEQEFNHSQCQCELY